MHAHSDPSPEGTPLVRGLGVWQATALNVANMVGIGPFITIPGFIAAMQGPQAMVAWVAAAVLVLCDGLVWSELGAALPASGGTYHFLREIFGRYNVCHLGDEVRDPGKTIPRAVLLSVALIATLYLTMNLAIIGVVPWQEAMLSHNIAAEFMERLYGRTAAVWLTALILWTLLAGMFAITLGYSRIPFAAARQGDFFPAFAYVHPRGKFPAVSLGVLGLLTAAFCFLDLGSVISAAVAVRILVQFVGQIAALHVLRKTRPDVTMPFRMWLYPLPSLIALAGWLFVFGMADKSVLLASLSVIGSGCLAFALWKLWQRVSVRS